MSCFYLDKRLAYLDECSINKFDNAVVNGLRTLHCHFVTNFDAKLSPIVVARRVLCTIDVDFACTIVEVEVTISSVSDSSNHTLHAISLAFRTCDNFGTSSIGYHRKTLDNIDKLSIATAVQLDFSNSAVDSFGSRESNGGFTLRAVHRRNGQPRRKRLSIEAPVVQCIHSDGGFATELRESYVRRRYAHVVEELRFIFVRTAYQQRSKHCDECRKNIF